MKRISQLEATKQCQCTQIDQLTKEVESLKKQESQLKKQIDECLVKLETQVQANSKAITDLQTTQGELKESISMLTSSGKKGSLLDRLMALESQVEANTKACKELKTEADSKGEDRNLIKKLFTENSKLHEEMNDLSAQVHQLQQAIGGGKMSTTGISQSKSADFSDSGFQNSSSSQLASNKYGQSSNDLLYDTIEEKDKHEVPDASTPFKVLESSKKKKLFPF